MLLRFVLIFIFNFFSHASSLHLGNRRNSELSALPEQINDTSTRAQPGILEIRLAGPTDVKGSRNNKEKMDDHSNRKTATSVHCEFTFHDTGGGPPKYVCTHRKDVKMEWHDENGRLTGTFTSNDCSKQRSLNDEMENLQGNVERKLGRSIREKRRTIYRDDAGDDETQDGDAEQTEEGGSIPPADGEDDVENKAEDTLEESQATQSSDVEKEIKVENDKEHPVDDEGGDKSEKEVNEENMGKLQVSDEGEEVPGVEKDDKDEEEKGVNEDETKEPEEVTNTELSAGDDTRDEEDEDKKGTNYETPIFKNKVNKEEATDGASKVEDNAETSEEGITDTNIVENDDEPKPKNDESKPDNDGSKPDNDESKPDNDEPKPDKDESKPDKDEPKPDNNGPKPDNDNSTSDNEKPKPEIGIGNFNEYDIDEILEWLGNLTWDDIDMDFQVGLEMIVTPNDILSFFGQIKDMFLTAGDYILSLLFKNLKRSLHKSHMEEKFNARVQELAKSRDGDADKALRALKTVIQRQFGVSYELEIVKYLKKLRDNMKL